MGRRNLSLPSLFSIIYIWSKVKLFLRKASSYNLRLLVSHQTISYTVKTASEKKCNRHLTDAIWHLKQDWCSCSIRLKVKVVKISVIWNRIKVIPLNKFSDFETYAARLLLYSSEWNCQGVGGSSIAIVPISFSSSQMWAVVVTLLTTGTCSGGSMSEVCPINADLRSRQSLKIS